jgi:hypothetical protein
MCPLALDETEIPITWTWCLKRLLIYLVFSSLVLGVLLLFAIYTQEPSPFVQLL